MIEKFGADDHKKSQHRSETAPPPLKQEKTTVVDPYATWTDERRMIEFAQTGSPQYLTPQLAERMGVRVGPDGELLELDARIDERVNRDILARHGFNISLLKGKNVHAAIEALLPLAVQVVPRHTDSALDVKDVAREEVDRQLFRRPEETVRALFEHLDPRSLMTIEIIRFLEDEYMEVKRRYHEADEFGDRSLRRRSKKVINAIISTADAFEEEFHKHQSYGSDLAFPWYAVQSFLMKIRLDSKNLSVVGEGDPDDIRPFEIAKGVYAAFSSDRNRIYIAPPEVANQVEEIYSTNLPARMAGREYFPFSQKDTYALIDHTHSIIDSGNLLTDLFPKEFEADPALLRDYIMLTHSSQRNAVQGNLAIRLNELSLREQLQFIRYAKTTTLGEFDRLRRFGAEFHEDGIRTFLVTANDEKLRQEVFEFAGSVSREEAKKVFEAYGKLVGSIDNVGDYLRESFGTEDARTQEEIVGRLLERARILLRNAYEHRERPERLAGLVGEAEQSNAVFLETFRALKGAGLLDLSLAKDIELQSARKGEVSDDDVRHMEDIVRRNYGREPEVFRDMVVKSMLTALKSDASRFNILRYKGQVVAFNRFDEMERMPDGRRRLYFGSFNVDANFGNGKMGELMIERTVEKESEHAVIEADCTSNAPIAAKYIESGFVGASRFEAPGGIPGLHIIFDRKANEQYVARRLSSEEFTTRARAGVDEAGVRYRTIDGVHGFESLSEGYVLTRYSPDGTGRFLAAFEKHR